MLIEIDCPLARNDLGVARNAGTSKNGFRSAISRMTACLFIEASKNIELRNSRVRTPLEQTGVKFIEQSKIALVPILRAGMWMVNPILGFLPEVNVYPVGIKRNETTLRPVTYYTCIPDDLRGIHIFLLDPMLATGGSISAAYSALLKRNPKVIDVLTIISAPEGIAKLKKSHPEARIYTVSLDRELNNKGYILPGLGDAGDRIFG